MADDRIREAFVALGAPRTPEPEFADELFDALIRERRRPARALRGLDPHRSQLRKLLTIAVAFLIAGVPIAVVIDHLSGSRDQGLGEAPVPGEPFEAVVAGSFSNPGNVLGSGYTESPGGTFRLEIDYRGPDAWRMELVDGTELGLPLIAANIDTAGSYMVFDGGTLQIYDAATGTTDVQLHAPGFSPLQLLSFVDRDSPWPAACQDGQVLGDGTLLGRPMHRLRCATSGSFGDRVDLWIDADSQLILRIDSHLPSEVGASTPVAGPINFVPGMSLTMTSLTYDPTFPPDAFAMPSGAPSAPPEPPPTSLTVGQPVPTFSGTDLGGATFDLAQLRGSPAALFLWAEWCPPCLGAPLDGLERARRADPSVSIVTIGMMTEPGALRSEVQRNGYGFPVVIPNDPDGLTKVWGTVGVPLLVLLDEQGRMVGSYGGFNQEIGSPSDMERVLDAFAAGDPLPKVPAFTSSQR